MQHQAFDVIGKVGFNKDFGATADLHGKGAQACAYVSTGASPPLQHHLSSCSIVLMRDPPMAGLLTWMGVC